MEPSFPYLDKAKMALRYGFGLPRFFLKPLSLAECYALVRRRVEEREENFLERVRRGVYSNPGSPYYKLLRHADCAYGDLEGMVRQKGLEKTLKKLSDAGVYITIEEYKGRKPVERSGLSFQTRPEDFDNPHVAAVREETSSGSRSKGVRNRLDFGYLADEAAAAGVMFDNLGFYGGPFVLCHNIIAVFLVSTKGGTAPTKWFMPLSGKRNKLASYYGVMVGKSLGYPIPWPERFTRQEADHVAQWLAQEKRTVPRMIVWTSASSAVRIASAARERGLDISGTHFIAGSEPLTPVRERIIRSAGCTVTARYACTEIGRMGYGCLHATGFDVHILKGTVAVTQQAREVGATGVTVDALRITSLLSGAPKILINMETGDYGTLEARACGCKFDEVGLTDHLSQIRSFEKLTSEGMTFFAGDLARIVEEQLPSKFGGSPLDYQAIEEQGKNGLSYLAILVSPKVGGVNEALLVSTVLEELRKARGDSGRMMAAVWQEAGTVKVRREEPHPTKGGKVFSFQVESR
jgi:hypothetical protein